MNDIKFIIADYSSHFDNYEAFINVLKCKLQCLHSKQLVYHGTNDPAQAKVLCDIYMNEVFVLFELRCFCLGVCFDFGFVFSDSNIFHINIFIKFLSEIFCQEQFSLGIFRLK